MGQIKPNLTSMVIGYYLSCPHGNNRILVAFYLINPEDISENFGESCHCKNLNFENFGESQLKMVSCKDL